MLRTPPSPYFLTRCCRRYRLRRACVFFMHSKYRFLLASCMCFLEQRLSFSPCSVLPSGAGRCCAYPTTPRRLSARRGTTASTSTPSSSSASSETQTSGMYYTAVTWYPWCTQQLSSESPYLAACVSLPGCICLSLHYLCCHS